MQGINEPRHALGKHYFHYEYHTDRVPHYNSLDKQLSLNCKQDKQDCNVRIMCMQRPENVHRNKRLLYGGQNYVVNSKLNATT